MKLKSLLILITACILFVFNEGCKKNQIKANTPKSVDFKSLSSKVALNFMQAVSGKIGGANINDGIKAPSGITMNVKGLRLFSVNPLCGYAIDTAYNFSVVSGDSTKAYKGDFHFTYTCSTDNVDGYTVRDSLTNTEVGALFNNTYTLGQNYVVKALDNTYTFVSMDGYVASTVFDRVLNAGGATVEYHYLAGQYNLTGLTVKITNGVADITSGTSKFFVFITNLDPTTSIDGSFYGYAGTITFLGNHKAKLTIESPSQSYMVDLLTGEVTPL
ncbi:MAG TPA: hypothetical protein VHA56_21545 [Mucilaginibacter sp.]|nr:hypothetical protein [Mucilaginibacter sp.]